MAEHSPLPWSAFGPERRDDALAAEAFVMDPSGQNVLFRSSLGSTYRDMEMPAANAAFIVRCVNSHDELLAALKLMVAEPEEQASHNAAIRAIAKAEGQ